MPVSRTVLHVDDEPQITEYMAGLLSQQGYSVISLNDSTRVMETITDGRVRVVLLDYDMPCPDGFSLLQEIKAFDGTIQVIMFTGMTNLTTMLKVLRRGAEACYFKPLNDVPCFLETLDHTFRKLEKWQISMKQICRTQYQSVGHAAVS